MKQPDAPHKKRKGRYVWVKAYLSELSKHGAPGVAAEAVSVHRSSIARARHRHPTFAIAEAAAKQKAGDRWEAEVARRAFEGVEEPVFHQGIECGTVRKYSDTLAMFMLKGLRPEKYRDGQTNISVNTSVAVTISEPERQKLLERRRLALTGGN